jgi:hypothetical protein
MLTDHFSLDMIPEGFTGTITLRPSSPAEARAMVEASGNAIQDGATRLTAMRVMGMPLEEPELPPEPLPQTLHPGDEIVLVHRYRSTGRLRFTLIDIGHPTEWRT